MNANDIKTRLQAELTARFPDWGFSVRMASLDHIKMNVCGRRRSDTSDEDVEAIREILLRYVPSAEIGWPTTAIGPSGTPFGKWLADRGFDVE